MKDLAKIDLDPNTVYNVSLSVTQGTKKFDNLRFFQSKTPKLFNIIPGQYSTFSRLTTALEPVIPTIKPGTGVFIPADERFINVTSVNWVTNWVFERSEQETRYVLGASTVTFTVSIASDPGTFNFSIDGFEPSFACLNGRSDWKRVNSTTFQITMPVLEFVPGLTADPKWVRTNINNAVAQTKFNNRAGNSLIYTKAKPKNVVAGQEIRISTQKGVACFPTHTKVLEVVSSGSTHYLILSAPCIAAIDKDKYFTFSNLVWTKGLSSYTESGNFNSAAKMKYYTSPSYVAIVNIYRFTGSSSISSEVLNSTVLDALIWEEDIRDFIYFFISDTAGSSTTSPTWYYFNNGDNNGGITPANLSGTRISGVALSVASGSGEDRVLNPPPPAPGYVTNTSLYPSYPAIALKARARFYDISKTNGENDASVPSLSHPASVRFAIARYVRSSDGINWSRSWLGTDNRMKNVLSLEEALS